MYRIPENEISNTICFIQLEVVSWFHMNNDSVHDSPSPNPRFTHLPDTNAIYSNGYVMY